MVILDNDGVTLERFLKISFDELYEDRAAMLLAITKVASEDRRARHDNAIRASNFPIANRRLFCFDQHLLAQMFRNISLQNVTYWYILSGGCRTIHWNILAHCTTFDASWYRDICDQCEGRIIDCNRFIRRTMQSIEKLKIINEADQLPLTDMSLIMHMMNLRNIEVKLSQFDLYGLVFKDHHLLKNILKFLDCMPKLKKMKLSTYLSGSQFHESIYAELYSSELIFQLAAQLNSLSINIVNRLRKNLPKMDNLRNLKIELVEANALENFVEKIWPSIVPYRLRKLHFNFALPNNTVERNLFNWLSSMTQLEHLSVEIKLFSCQNESISANVIREVQQHLESSDAKNFQLPKLKVLRLWILSPKIENFEIPNYESYLTLFANQVPSVRKLILIVPSYLPYNHLNLDLIYRKMPALETLVIDMIQWDNTLKFKILGTQPSAIKHFSIVNIRKLDLCTIKNLFSHIRNYCPQLIEFNIGACQQEDYLTNESDMPQGGLIDAEIAQFIKELTSLRAFRFTDNFEKSSFFEQTMMALYERWLHENENIVFRVPLSSYVRESFRWKFPELFDMNRVRSSNFHVY